MKITVKLDCSATWTETHDVEVPDGCSREEAEDIVAAYTEDCELNPEFEAEVHDWTIPDSVQFGPPRVLPVPPDAWALASDGHKWATDGRIAIRDDTPVPVGVVQWLSPGVDVSTALARPRGSEVPAGLAAAPPRNASPRDFENHARQQAVLAGLDLEYASEFVVGLRGGEPVVLCALWRPE